MTLKTLREEPYSMPVAATPSGHDVEASYTNIRANEFEESHPDFTTRTRRHQHLSVGIELRAGLVTRRTFVPDGALLIFEVYDDPDIGRDAIEADLLPHLAEEAFAGVAELMQFDLLGFMTDPRIGKFSRERTFVELQVWPFLDSPDQLYADLMERLIPGNMPAGLAIHLAYDDGGQIVIINIWQNEQVAMAFHRKEFLPVWESLISDEQIELVPAACLGMAVDQALSYSAAMV